MVQSLNLPYRTYIWAHWIAANPLVVLGKGLAMVALGGLDLIETGRGALDSFFTSEFGLVLAGLQQAGFGLANVLLGTRLAGIGLLGAEHGDHHPTINRMLKGYVENPFLTFALGIMILAMVFIHAWQEWVMGRIDQTRSVWYFGLALMALLAIARSAESVLLALGMMADAESKGQFVVRWASRINRYVRSPRLLVVVAVISIVLGFAEELYVIANDNGTGVFIAHYGFLLFTLLEISKLIPIIFPGVTLLNEALTPSGSNHST